MVSTVIAPAARGWIRERAHYLVDYSPAAAQRFRDAMRDAVLRLSRYPYSGPPGLIPDSRRLVVGDYVISYRVRVRHGDPIRVEIFAVRHGRQGDAREPY